ncbi:MAG: Uma2 family endonuclease [Spirulinaceae cyanobacterium SM2_1_0]|nr:Uma2 family endonuclease [Spirulinaceae cyanobacterium SM2_1_0]
MTLTPISPTTEIEYPDSDGTPMAESDPTRKGLTYAVEALELHFAEHPAVYVSGNSFVYYQQGVKDAVVSPDVYVVLGAENRQRRSYKVWEENGLTPDFIIEITSASTRHTDSVEKRRIYADLGVTEYFQYDPTGDYLEPPLIGLRLTAREYEPMPAGGNGSGAIAIHSEVLNLELRLDAGQLRFYKPDTGQKLPSYSEAVESLTEAEASRREEQARRERAEVERQQAIENLYNGAERLLATGMSVEQVATLLDLDADDLQRRFGTE